MINTENKPRRMQLLLDEDNILRLIGLFLSTILIIYLLGQFLGFWSVIWLPHFKNLKTTLRNRELTLQQIKQRDEYFCFTLQKFSELNLNISHFSNLNSKDSNQSLDILDTNDIIYSNLIHHSIINKYTDCLKMFEYFNSLSERTSQQEQIIKEKYTEIIELKKQIRDYQDQLLDYDIILEDKKDNLNLENYNEDDNNLPINSIESIKE